MKRKGILVPKGTRLIGYLKEGFVIECHTPNGIGYISTYNRKLVFTPDTIVIDPKRLYDKYLLDLFIGSALFFYAMYPEDVPIKNIKTSL